VSEHCPKVEAKLGWQYNTLQLKYNWRTATSNAGIFFRNEVCASVFWRGTCCRHACLNRNRQMLALKK
jgi:hypothetical protein